MATPNKIFINDELHDFIRRAASEAPEQLNRYLNDADRRILSNLDSSTLDEKLHVLGILNYRFAVVIANRHKISSQPAGLSGLFGLVRFFKTKVAGLVGKTLKQYGLFVMADKEVMEALSAASCQSKGASYYLLRDYEEVALSAEQISEAYRAKSIELQAIRTINAVLAETLAMPFLLARTYEKDRYKCEPTLLPVLFYLAARPDEAATIRQMGLHFGYAGADTKVKVKVYKLIRAGMVQKVGEKSYQLTGYGVHTVSMIRERILAQSAL